MSLVIATTLSLVLLQQAKRPPSKFQIDIPKEYGFTLDYQYHSALPNGKIEVSTLLFKGTGSRNMLSVSVSRSAGPPSKEAMNGNPSDGGPDYQPPRRGLPSGLTIGDNGYTRTNGNPHIAGFAGNVRARVHLTYQGSRVNGEPRFDTSTKEEDLRLIERLARQAMSIAMLWKFAGPDANTEQQREALIEAGYSRLGPWMTQKGFETQFDNMLRVATFTKGNQKIKLAEGSREGFDGTVRKDHGSLIIGFQGELWAKTSPLSSWIN